MYVVLCTLISQSISSLVARESGSKLYPAEIIKTTSKTNNMYYVHSCCGRDVLNGMVTSHFVDW